MKDSQNFEISKYSCLYNEAPKESQSNENCENTQPYSDDIEESENLIGFQEKIKPSSFTVDELLSKIGFRFIQWYSVIALICCNVGQSMYSYNLPYLELMPELLCKVRNRYGVCTVEKVCSGSNFLQWKIDWHNEMTIHNWLTDTHSLCIGGFRIGLIGSCFFAGVLIATILSQLSDVIGRKRFIQITSFFGIIGVYALYFGQSLNIRMVFCFVLGMLNSIYFCSYTYLLEISPKSWRGFTNFLFLLIELAIPKMIGSLYFYLGGKEWTSLFAISLILTPIGFIMVCFIPESPSYLVNRNKIQNAKFELNFMARTNLCKLPAKYEIIEENNCANNNQGTNCFSYFKSARACIMLVVMVVLLSHANFNLSMWIFFEKYINVNMFFMNILDAIICTMVILSTYQMVKFLDVKAVLIIMLVISMICASPFMVNLAETNYIYLFVGALGVSACLNSLSILTYLFISDSFPQIMLPMVIGIANFGSNIAQVLSPEAAEIKAPGPIVIFTISTTFTLMCMILIKKENSKEGFCESKKIV